MMVYVLVQKPVGGSLKKSRCFSLSLKTGRNQCPGRNSEAGGVPSHTDFLFFSDLQLIR